MNEQKDGGPAFPSNIHPNNADMVVTGMTLRDYFAAAAMQTGLQGSRLPTKADRDHWLPIIAGISYEVADAVLRERAKP